MMSMTVTENRCIGCFEMGLECIGSSCSFLNVPVSYCDNCGEELDERGIYDVDGNELCGDCVLDLFRRSE